MEFVTASSTAYAGLQALLFTESPSDLAGRRLAGPASELASGSTGSTPCTVAVASLAGAVARLARTAPLPESFLRNRLERARGMYDRNIGIISPVVDLAALGQTARANPESFFFTLCADFLGSTRDLPRNVEVLAAPSRDFLGPLAGCRLVDQLYLLSLGPLHDALAIASLLPVLSAEGQDPLTGEMMILSNHRGRAFDFLAPLEKAVGSRGTVQDHKGLWTGQMPEFARIALGELGSAHAVSISPPSVSAMLHPSILTAAETRGRILAAHKTGVGIHLEVGSGASPDSVRELARQHPEKLFVGVDPCVLIDPLVPVEPNLLLCRSTSHELLEGLHGLGCLDSIRILAPYGFQKGYIHDPDICDFSRVLKPGGEFSVYSELFVWTQDYAAAVEKHFGNAALVLYAQPGSLDREEEQPRFRIKYAPFCVRYWDYSTEGSDPSTGQWGIVAAEFYHASWQGGRRVFEAPLLPRHQAPRSLYDDYNNRAVIFQVRGIR